MSNRLAIYELNKRNVNIDIPLFYRYNTRSNKVRIIKTPGGELRYLHLKKKGTAPKCGDCGIKLPGVSAPCPCIYDAV